MQVSSSTSLGQVPVAAALVTGEPSITDGKVTSKPKDKEAREKEKKRRQSQSCDSCRVRKIKCSEATEQDIQRAIASPNIPGSGPSDPSTSASASGSPLLAAETLPFVPALTKDQLITVTGAAVPRTKEGRLRGVCRHCLILGLQCRYDYVPRKRGPPNMYLKRMQEAQAAGQPVHIHLDTQGGRSAKNGGSYRPKKHSTGDASQLTNGNVKSPSDPVGSMGPPTGTVMLGMPSHQFFGSGLEYEGMSFVRGHPLNGTSPDDISGASGGGGDVSGNDRDDSDLMMDGDDEDLGFPMGEDIGHEIFMDRRSHGDDFALHLNGSLGTSTSQSSAHRQLEFGEEGLKSQLAAILSPTTGIDGSSYFNTSSVRDNVDISDINLSHINGNQGGAGSTSSSLSLSFNVPHTLTSGTLSSIGGEPHYHINSAFPGTSPVSNILSGDHRTSSTAPMLQSMSGVYNPLDAILPRPLLRLIINLFFDYVFALTPCLHKPTFFRDLLRRREEQPGEEEWTTLVLATVMSTLVQVPRAYVPLSRREVRDLAARCHQETRKWSLNGYKQPTVNGVIIRYFDAVYNYCRGEVGTCHTSLNEAQALATVMQLHEEESYTYLNPIEREIRRRIFFLMFGADKSEAILLGRPVRMREEDCYSLRLPEELDDECITEDGYLSQPAGVTSLITGFNAITRIHCYAGRLMTKHREDKRDPPSGPRLHSRLNELDKLHDQIMSVMDRCPSALRLKTGLDSRAQSPAGGWDIDAQAKLQEFFFDSKASREIARDAFLVQQGNIYVTQQLARFVLLQYRNDLLSLRSSSAGSDATRGAISGSHSLNDGWTPSGGIALGGIGKAADLNRAQRDHVATDKESLFYDLLTILHSIPIQSIAVNGPSLVNNVRYVASALLDAVQGRPNKPNGGFSADTGTRGDLSASVLRAQGYLLDFLSILSEIEKNYQLDDED